MFAKKKTLLLLLFLILISFAGGLNVSAAGKKKLVLIDPAHGGKDYGIQLNNDTSEKDITLAVALLIKKELSGEKNIEVVLTRETDQNIDLEERREIIKKIKPDFFISLHINGGFGKNASGFELYYPEYAENTINEKKKAKDDNVQLKNKAQNDSLVMAKTIQENLSILFPRQGRGLRKADLPVIEGFTIPALAVELSFGTNTEDKKKLLSSKIQADIAKTLTKSIRTFFR